MAFMIVGHGSLSKLLKDREGALLFCSGVGNSQCVDEAEYKREYDKLSEFMFEDKYMDKSLFYFSSFVKPNNRYGWHKEFMESTVRLVFQNYTIIRVGNIWECTNPNTFLNYLRSHPEAEVREHEIKYMTHANELNMICQSLPLKGCHEVSTFSEMLTVKECLKRWI